jgi:hypothetical protein
MCLSEEPGLVNHVLARLVRPCGTGRGIGQRVGEPVADMDVHVRYGMRSGIVGLLSGKREAGNADPASQRELPCGGALAAADVHTRLAGHEAQPIADPVDERFDSLAGRLATRRPQPTMDMLPPQATINRIELVVVIRDRCGILGSIGDDHAVTLQRRSTPP